MTHSVTGLVTIHWDEMTAATVQLLGFDNSAAESHGGLLTAAVFTSDYTVGHAWFSGVPASDDHERRQWIMS